MTWAVAVASARDGLRVALMEVNGARALADAYGSTDPIDALGLLAEHLR